MAAMAWDLGRAAALAAKAGVSAFGAFSASVAFFTAFPKPWIYLKQERVSLARLEAEDGLSYEELRLADGGKAWLVARGTSGDAAICLCHGRSKHKAHNRPLIRALASQYTVLAFDFPGHGENAYGPTSLGWREAGTVQYALDALQREGFQRVLLYGCSMGGAAALINQAREPSSLVRGVITDGTFGSFSDSFRALVELNGWWMPSPLRGVLFYTSLKLAGLLAGYDPWSVRPAESIKDISVPVLILQGRSDSLVPPYNAEQLQRGARQGCVHFYQGGHDEPNNPEVQEAILSFAKKLW
ncbi:unnamed protein product [Effrenium voratum]|nr:unnamed protein product [Effrenium voratum]